MDSPSLLESLIHHVVLPPCLPGKQERAIAKVGDALTDRLLVASRTIRNQMSGEYSAHWIEWDSIRRSIQTSKLLNAGGKLNKTSLLREFQELGQNDILILHIVEQNAVLLIRQHHDAQNPSVVFESFEAAPLSESVLASKQALQWDFPGTAVAISLQEWSKLQFQEELAVFLEQASTESIKRFAARTNKAGSFAFESRDTVDPSLITSMLMTLLEVNGSRVFPPLLRKRVRDDVLWAPGAEKPWRRCPLWLALRVGIQRHLSTLFGNEAGRVHYKFFICLTLINLIDEVNSTQPVNPESLAFLKAKLCRRLVKLEVDKDRATACIHPVYEYFFTNLGPLFRKTVQRAVDSLELSWANVKSSIARPIHRLPRYPEQQDKYLTLPNSGPYLQQAMDSFRKENTTQPPAPYRLPMDHNSLSGTARLSQNFAKRYASLSRSEEELEEVSLLPVPSSTKDQEELCIEISSKLRAYLNDSKDHYESNPEQKSIQLLTVMELWMLMDKCAVASFSLLKDYDTGFPPNILDVLQLARLKDMDRLQKIRDYLKLRHTACKSPRTTIFVDPTELCFAVRYYDESPDSTMLQELHCHIEAQAEEDRIAKEEEWKEMSTEYEQLIKHIDQSSCIFTTDTDLPSFVTPVPVHDDRRCTKCFLQRKSRKFKILIHEHPLPQNDIQAKAVIFELGRPKAFEVYRDITWRIISTLGFPKQVLPKIQPKVLLDEYTELEPYTKPCSFSLGSTTKSFLATHYSRVPFPVSLEQICRPNGLKLGYFDSLTNSWSRQMHFRPTFAHHCSVLLPKSSPFSVFIQNSDFAADSKGPTSYKVISSQTSCPPGLNVHEYMAFQSMYSCRRWPQIVTELGSSSLNFSSEATTVLISHLSLQVGPSDGDTLGIFHQIFRDNTFCERLVEQLSSRLDAISFNWREVYCMEMLITLIIRLNTLASSPFVLSEASNLLDIARNITHGWTKNLRSEIQKATDIDTVRRCSRYALLSSLLCRRTFALEDEDDDTLLQPKDLQCFIECSIGLQDNLSGDPAALPQNIRNSLIQDTKMTHRMRFLLRDSVEADPQSFMSAVSTFWPESPETEDANTRSFSDLKFLNHQDGWWVESVVTVTGSRSQTLHYHLLQGHLLVDFQPLGKLPSEHRDSIVLDQLFGQQSLLTWPSAVPGMTYMLAVPMFGSHVHLGFRRNDNKLFVRAISKHTVLEYIQPEVFIGGATNFDLPTRLVENAVHWLNLTTGCIEIRQRPKIWTSSPGNWSIDLKLRQATRYDFTLIDPHSRLYKKVASVFQFFEKPENVTIMQEGTKSITADLRRLELKFYINKEGLLQSPQLQAEIDPNQDAGTFYGLHSKLVLRKINTKQRSIIVPMGKVIHSRQGFHVSVHVENEGFYTQFIINPLLGRLECPADPRLLYLKAELHAYTSFVLPDPLTGRTGVEEACAILESGYSQPWQPLDLKPYRSLVSIRKLTPKREYYPEDLKVMQRAYWDPELTTTIQHDEFRPIVEAIINQSNQLSVFALQKTVLEELEAAGDLHLSDRSHSRRVRYERSNSGGNTDAAGDLVYDARDRCRPTTARSNVFESVSLIRNWDSEMSTATDLAGIIQTWPIIEGYSYPDTGQDLIDSICDGSVPDRQDRIFDKLLLSDRLGLEFAAHWGPLVNLCRASGYQDKYRLMFLFGLLSFRSDVDMKILRALLAFSIFVDLKGIERPKWSSYTNFRPNPMPRSQHLISMMKPYLVPYKQPDDEILSSFLSAKQRKQSQALEFKYGKETEEDCKALSEFLIKQWPCPEPSMEGFSRPVMIELPAFLEILRPEWLRLFQNHELANHLIQVQQVLIKHHSHIERTKSPKLTVPEEQVVLPSRFRGGEFPSLSHDLLRKDGPKLPKPLQSSIIPRDTAQQAHINSCNCKVKCNGVKPCIVHKKTEPSAALPPEIEELQRIINEVISSKSIVRQQYGKDLNQSLLALKALQTAPQSENMIPPENIAAEVSKARNIARDNLDEISNSFEFQDSRVPWLKAGGLWPAITPVVILEQLRSTCVPVFGSCMRQSIIKYALSISNLQRLIRMENAHLKGDESDEQNAGHSNWDPAKNTDWLLLEIDANILIRPDQATVAEATIAPSSKANSVLQMNMGQGKTSCIMPMVAAALADNTRKKLVRVIVPKPLLLQTAQLLHARLGGLVGRKLKHIPFSRKTSTKNDVIKTFYSIHTEIMKSSGIIIALPEHLLSFFLSGQQRLSDGGNRISEATQMMRVQAWMRKVARDVLDESDITLAVKTQLIYPSGSQKTVDGHPHRWETAETLLRLVEGHLYNLHSDFPQSIEIVRRSAGFPFVYFLRRDVEEALLTRLVNDICSGKTSLLPIRDYPESDQKAVKQFISEAKVSEDVTEQIRHIFPDKPAAKQNIYLLRGLLVHRILLLTLKKRWNVQYGIHPTRDPIAVPFHAKGVPSEQSDFGHPDVAILLTCMAFYYEGLNIHQLRQSLVNVLKGDDPSSEYDRWCHSSESLPDSLREWNAINVDDEAQLLEIWTHTRYNVTVINYFMNSFVFPKHARQFQMKLLAAGWDLPLILPAQDASIKYTPLTTGFSGTNDNRNMLPLTIKQQDLQGLSHTNAEVLTYLLQFRNRTYVGSRTRLSERDLLKSITKMKIKVLIDAGAQILEMDNLSLVKSWLEIYTEAPAAVYFNEQNKPMVLYRQGRVVPLLGTPFADNLHNCLVYLDEAHTRGTDLKLPTYARGALTLGPGQTKDHTVQAAMRLRQLGSTQSVVFFAPPEVHQSILDLCGKRRDSLTSHDVIRWLLEQTTEGIEQLMPLYFSQGADFCRRIQAAVDNPDFLFDTVQRDNYLKALRQNERQTIIELYNPKLSSKAPTTVGPWCKETAAYMKELKTRRRGFQDTGGAVHSSALQEVEQEREVAFEVENVREVQKPTHYSPLSFPGLHKDLTSFAMTGRLAAGSGAYELAFKMMGKTSVGRKYGIDTEATTGRLYVSTEFSRTVNMPLGRASQDNFQRQVNWILWSVVSDTALIIIPEEAERLMPLLRDAEDKCCVLVSFAAPVTRKMLHFNNLTYYSIPTLPKGWEAPMWLKIELGIFSGRLYFRWEEYDDLLRFLGFTNSTGSGKIVETDNADLPVETDTEDIAEAEETELVRELEEAEVTEVIDEMKEMKVTEALEEKEIEAPEEIETPEEKQIEDTNSEESREEVIGMLSKQGKSFTKKPLTFLQEWLALRRKGQDFTHTPMGYVCQGKPLSENHPFFAKLK